MNPIAAHDALLGLSDADLTAIGGVGAFLATVVLAAVAAYQVRESRRQTRAMQAQVDAAQAAMKAQLRPHVVPQPQGWWTRGPNELLHLGAREAALQYILSNDGTGLATNVQHGVDIGNIVHAPGFGVTPHSIRPGDSFPPTRDSATRQAGELLMIAIHESEVPDKWWKLPVTYWVKYETVFGEKLETRIGFNPRLLPDFLRDQYAT